MRLIRKTRFAALIHGVTWILTGSVLTGCGSIIHGSKQQVSFDSKPQGATVKLTNGTRPTTPQTVELRRAEDHTVTIEKDGYETESITLKRDFNAVATILGNILWLVPGVIVDVLVGGAWTLDLNTSASTWWLRSPSHSLLSAIDHRIPCNEGRNLSPVAYEPIGFPPFLASFERSFL